MTSILKGSNAIKNVSLERHKKSLIKFETLYCLWPSLRSILSRFWVFFVEKIKAEIGLYLGYIMVDLILLVVKSMMMIMASFISRQIGRFKVQFLLLLQMNLRETVLPKTDCLWSTIVENLIKTSHFGNCKVASEASYLV